MIRQLTEHIVCDSEICHGQPTFKGTRILVKGVLEQLEAGWDWDKIIYAWDDKIDEAAIREVIQLASGSFLRELETETAKAA